MNPKPAGPSDQAPRDDAIIDEATLRFILDMLVGRVDAASQALIAHEFEGAGAFGVDRRATRDSAAELARVNEALRACERGTRSRVAADAAHGRRSPGAPSRWRAWVAATAATHAY